MKNLKEIIKEKLCHQQVDEKLIISKDSKLKSANFNKVFDNIEEFVKELEDYLRTTKNNVPLPIEIVTSDKIFRPIGPHSTDGVYVKKHFKVSYNKKSILRGGCPGKEYSTMILQIGYKDYNDKMTYERATLYPVYEFGKDNFMEWLQKLDTKKYQMLKKLFNVE